MVITDIFVSIFGWCVYSIGCRKTIQNTQLYLKFSKYILLDNNNLIMYHTSEERGYTFRQLSLAILKHFRIFCFITS